MGKAEREWNRSESTEASGNDVGVVGLWADYGFASRTRDELINLEVGVYSSAGGNLPYHNSLLQ